MFLYFVSYIYIEMKLCMMYAILLCIVYFEMKHSVIYFIILCIVYMLKWKYAWCMLFYLLQAIRTRCIHMALRSERSSVVVQS